MLNSGAILYILSKWHTSHAEVVKYSLIILLTKRNSLYTLRTKYELVYGMGF
jgi:hypothetical protein